MAKITNLNEVQEMAAIIIDGNDYDLTARIGRDRAIWCLVAIYTTNDICKGYGQDFYPLDALNVNDGYNKVSVISFDNGISVIDSGYMSRYTDRFPLCGYESLYDDLYQIAIDIQACFDRIAAATT